MEKISLIYPGKIEYKEMPSVTFHDLALDELCKKLSKKDVEQKMIASIICKMSKSAKVAQYRGEVFADIYQMKDMRNKIMELLEKVKFIKDFGSFKKDHENDGSVWGLMHRLDEISDYIKCVEDIRECLKDADIKSEGLKNLKQYVDETYEDAHFAEMKKDIQILKKDTDEIKSITLGINLNERFEVSGVGIVSINNKAYKKSNIVSNFASAISSKNALNSDLDSAPEMRYKEVDFNNAVDMAKFEKLGGFMAISKAPLTGMAMASTVANMPEKDASLEVTQYMDKTINMIIGNTVKKLKDVLSKYTVVSITTITDLIPEFIYYIRFAELIEGLQERGLVFSKPEVAESTQAKGFYNMKLAFADLDKDEIVANDISFDDNRNVYILTGANRGGKTTVTQAVGQLFALAQGGIFVPAENFKYVPVDMIYTHFPADEDKTLDLGRLGEECTRFKEMFESSTKDSLLLLNETFSTTSFEEGYYIARDSVKAIMTKGVRTLYNTHMHKLAFDIKELNQEVHTSVAASLVVCAENGQRSFKIKIAEPEGKSHARDIAEKYGVTFEMLTR